MKNRILNFGPELDAIIKKCSYCVVSMVDTEGMPYAVPMNFGYQDGVIFLHSGPEGKKIDILKEKPEVCITFSTDHVLRWQSSDVACSYSMKYRSVLFYGTVSFITDFDEKEAALDCIMQQYTDEAYRFSEPAVKNVAVMKVSPTRLEGRAYGY